MIETKLFFALISYYFVMFATPGPNNAMLTASGIKYIWMTSPATSSYFKLHMALGKPSLLEWSWKRILDST